MYNFCCKIVFGYQHFISQLIFQILQSISTGVIPNINDNPPDAEALRYLLVLPMYHEMLNAKLMKCLQLPLANVITKLKTAPLKLFTAWCHDAPKECFERIVDIFKNIVYLHLKNLTAPNLFVSIFVILIH